MDIQEYIQSGIIESYALGMASPAEAAELEMLAQQHPEIMQAVHAFSDLLEKNSQQSSVQPPAELKSKIFAALEDEFAAEPEKDHKHQAPVISISGNESAGHAMRYSWKYIAAASLIMFAVSGALNIYYYNNYKSVNTKYQALLIDKTNLQASNDVYQTKLKNYQNSIDILQTPGIKEIKMAGVAGKENNLATVFWNEKTSEVYFFDNNMQQVPTGKQYQLWAIVNGAPVDAGVIGTCDGLCKMKNISGAQAFAITLEKEGGSPTPTLTDMFVLGKV